MTIANVPREPAMEGFPPPAPPLPCPAPPRYRAPGSLAVALQACLIGCVAGAAVVAASAVRDLRLLARFERSSSSVTIWDVESMRQRSTVIGAIWLLLLGVTAALFIAWTSRLYRNLTALWITDLRFGDGWAIGGWFVPFLNLVRPKQIVDDIWRATNSPESTVSHWRDQKVPPVLNLWWTAWLVTLFLGAGVPSREGTLDDIRRHLARELTGNVMLALSAVFAVHVVRRTSRQEQLLAEQRMLDVGTATGRAQRGRPRPIAATLLIIGLGAGSLGVAVYAIAHVQTVSNPAPSAAAASPAATDVPIRPKRSDKLEVGDCFDLPAGVAEASEHDTVGVDFVDKVPCNTPHDAEVIAVITHPADAGADFPGDDALVEFGMNACVERFDDAVGVPFLESDLNVSVMMPLPDGWSFGDRSIQCVALRVDGAKLDRTALGSGI